VTKALPRQAISTYVPAFKYLSIAGLWSKGKWDPTATVNAAARARGDKYSDLFSGLRAPSDAETVVRLEKEHGAEWILSNALDLPSYTNDHEGLRDFLVRHKTRRNDSWWGTQYGKAAVAYDWLRFGAD